MGDARAPSWGQAASRMRLFSTAHSALYSHRRRTNAVFSFLFARGRGIPAGHASFSCVPECKYGGPTRPPGNVEGTVRDETGTPIAGARVYFGQSQITDGPSVLTDKKGHYLLRLTAGDRNIRSNLNAEDGRFAKYSQIKNVSIPERGKMTLDLELTKIEPYSPAKDGAWDQQDACAPEQFREKNYARSSEDQRRMGRPEIQGDFELRIGSLFMKVASEQNASPRPGSPAEAFMRTQPQTGRHGTVFG